LGIKKTLTPLQLREMYPSGRDAVRIALISNANSSNPLWSRAGKMASTPADLYAEKVETAHFRKVS
jgi:hypothetical protein